MRHESSVIVNRPIDEVWEFMTDPFNVPRFGTMTLGFRQTSPGPVGLGTTGQGRIVILGFETRISVTVTEMDPPHTFAFSMTGAGIRSGSLRQTLEATADGTKVVRVSEFEPQGMLKLLWPIVGPFVRRRMDAADPKIKRFLEAGRN
jgi:carbon monoxide dehydrogenase subunit G